jgi:hypothetical protein
MEFGETPTANLTSSEFQTMEMEDECEPPAFIRAREAERLQQDETLKKDSLKKKAKKLITPKKRRKVETEPGLEGQTQIVKRINWDEISEQDIISDLLPPLEMIGILFAILFLSLFYFFLLIEMCAEKEVADTLKTEEFREIEQDEKLREGVLEKARQDVLRSGQGPPKEIQALDLNVRQS